MKKINIALILNFIMIIIIISCTPSKHHKRYPTRQIDKPYTLPYDVDTWETHANGNYRIYNSGSHKNNNPYPMPLIFRQSLSDNFTLHWFILPSGLSYQFYMSDESLFGGSFVFHTLAINYGSSSGFFWHLEPSLKLFFRQKISNDIAITFYNDFVNYYGSQVNDYLVDNIFKSGSLFQVIDNFAVEPFVGIYYSNKFSSFSTGFNPDGDSSSSEFTYRKTNFIYFPLGLSLYFHAFRQWELNIEYTYESFPNESLSHGHSYNIKLIHSW